MHLVASVRPFVTLSCLNRLGARLWRVQQSGIIIVKFEAKNTITSLRYLSVSVNVGHLRLMSRMWSICF